MKNILIGLILGVTLTFSFGAYAEEIESVVGKAVKATFPILIDGKQLENEVIVIEGTSYIPVREAGEVFGYKVDFVNNQVTLDKEEGEIMAVETTTEETPIVEEVIEGPSKEDIERSIRKLESKIGRLLGEIQFHKGDIQEIERKEELTTSDQQEIDTLLAKVRGFEQEIAGMEQEKDELEIQLASF